MNPTENANKATESGVHLVFFHPRLQLGAAHYVFAPSGRVLETQPLPPGVNRATNCSFGDHDLDTLYVTTGGGVHLFRVHNTGRRAL